MSGYLFRRLLLLPLTLFCILLVNFLVLSLAPGEPTESAQVSQTGEATKEAMSADIFGSDMRYLEFRQRYGLTLPALLNWWPWISFEGVEKRVAEIAFEKEEGLTFSELQKKKRQLGDQAPYLMGKLLRLAEDQNAPLAVRESALRFFVRGGTKIVQLGPSLPLAVKRENQQISRDNFFLLQTLFDSKKAFEESVEELRGWWRPRSAPYTFSEKAQIFFFETRLFRYLSRVLTLDFGTLREDANRSVVSEVVKRFQYSLTLSVTPMVITFALSIFFGFVMALWRGSALDTGLNVLFLLLFALPIFVAAPFLIEEVALNHTFPFTNVPIPISGFTSPETVYSQMTSSERLLDIMRHIALPIVAIMYGMLATQSRLARTAVLEVAQQNFVRTARAKGLSKSMVWFRYIGRNASITIVTSLAGSLGIILGGSLIVETLFNIDGFGKFFYDGVLNRDYNVIMFSALAGSFLTLVGYLVADIAYTLLDPRVTLE